MELNSDQQQAFNNVVEWIAKPSSPFLTLGGYAGTGKTTLLAYIRKHLKNEKKLKKLSVSFVCYTGKAANVLKQKLDSQNALGQDDSVSTIHHLIYKPVEDEQGNIVDWVRRGMEDVAADLIVVDEGSMINETIWGDLLFFEKPILVVGDHGQLPPVEGRFNLMANPEIRLETIVRQQAENPIIRLSQMVRRGLHIPVGKFEKTVVKLPRLSPEDEQKIFAKYDENYLILCGRNATRVRLNMDVRRALGHTGAEPEKGERVICLKNDREINVYNGMLGWIRELRPYRKHWYRGTIKLDGEEMFYRGKFLKNQFGLEKTIHSDRDLGILGIRTSMKKMGNLFDWGYALTVHKAQGSEAPNVIVYEERLPVYNDEIWRRWLYTAITRSSEKLVIIGS
ncbi:MAG: AAA family ATPase [bacterium]|nr:AAA family ATPase [bacterium]